MERGALHGPSAIVCVQLLLLCTPKLPQTNPASSNANPTFCGRCSDRALHALVRHGRVPVPAGLARVAHVAARCRHLKAVTAALAAGGSRCGRECVGGTGLTRELPIHVLIGPDWAVDTARNIFGANDASVCAGRAVLWAGQAAAAAATCCQAGAGGVTVHAWATGHAIVCQQHAGVLPWVCDTITIEHLLSGACRARVCCYATHSSILAQAVVASSKVTPSSGGELQVVMQNSSTKGFTTQSHTDTGLCTAI